MNISGLKGQVSKALTMWDVKYFVVKFLYKAQNGKALTMWDVKFLNLE